MNHCDRVGCWEGTLQTGFQCCFAALPFVVGALLARSFRHRSTSSEYRQRPTLSSVPGPGQLLAVAKWGRSGQQHGWSNAAAADERQAGRGGGLDGIEAQQVSEFDGTT